MYLIPLSEEKRALTEAKKEEDGYSRFRKHFTKKRVLFSETSRPSPLYSAVRKSGSRSESGSRFFSLESFLQPFNYFITYFYTFVPYWFACLFGDGD